MRTAVLIIDVQRALAEGEYKTYDAQGVIARLNSVTQAARESNAPVFFVQHESVNHVLAKGSTGWEFAPGLQVDQADTVVPKKTQDCFHETTLQERLQALGIKHLVIGGMQTDFCVDTTVRRGLALGYSITLIEDGHTTLDNSALSAQQIIAHHNAVLSTMSSFGVRAELAPAAQVEFLNS
jgi:nicotinamidase-related amidase